MLSLVVAVAILWWVPAVEVQRHGVSPTAERFPELVNDYRRTWATIAGGIAVVIGLWFTWQQVELRRQTQVTERFSKAVDQLGSDELEIRIGSIYALERIAQDSERDHWPIMEVLTAFVRERTRGVELPSRTRATPSHPFADVQAALTVIGQRDTTKDPEEYSLDLSEAKLNEANLTDASLKGAQLDNTDLRNAWLGHADLRGGWLHDADLRNAVLAETDFRGAYLKDADLRNPSLARPDFRGADLSEATLRVEDFGEAQVDEDTVFPGQSEESDD